MNKSDSFIELLDVIDTLLGENGCSWDKNQTHKSLIPSILEECYEVIDAADNHDDINLCEELGDLLFLIMLNCKIAEKSASFDYNDCIENVRNKMVYRHPHVFSEKSQLPEGEVLKNWDELKKKEKGYIGDFDMPKALPALVKANKVSKKLIKMKPELFSLDYLADELQKYLSLLKSDISSGDSINAENLGTIFFILVTISTKYDINAEFTLTNAIETFINKFGS